MSNSNKIITEEDFTKDEKEFIHKHHLNIDNFYDGRGETKDERHDNAKRLGKSLVLSDTPCRKAGHRIRTRSGHCAQCNPTVIRYIDRYVRPGIVYLAVSADGYIKVGMTENNTGASQFSVKNRKGSLNGYDGYGGHNGWDIIRYWKVPNAGRIEGIIHDKLAPYARNSEYFHGDKDQVSQEIFHCSEQTALNAIENVLHQEECL